MTSILGTELHRYDMDELSGRMIDRVGSFNSNDFGGATAGDGEKRTTDGVDDREGWDTPNVPFDNSADNSWYIVMKTLEALNGVSFEMMAQGLPPSAANRGIEIIWNDTGLSNTVRFSTNQSTDRVDLAIGREFDANEFIFVACTFEASSDQLHVALRTDMGIDLAGSDIQNSETQTNVGINLGANGANNVFHNMEYYKFGGNATFVSPADLQATLDDLEALFGVGGVEGIKGGGPRVNFRKDVLRQTRINRSLARFIR